MRVLLAHKFFWNMGGAEVFFRETGRVLEENGHDVAYFSTQDDRNEETPFSKYFVRPPAYLGKGGVQSGRVSLARRALDLPRAIYSFEAKRKFAELLNDFQPDIVHMFAIYVHLSPSILHACRTAYVPVVMSCNDYKLICPNYRMYHHGHVCEDCRSRRFYMPVVNKCCQDSWALSVASSMEAYVHAALDIYRRNVNMFLFASEFMAGKTADVWGADTFKWRMLRNPFDLSSSPYSDTQADFCLFFGRLVEEKGVDVLVKAMQHVPSNIRLVVVGDGPLEEDLTSMSQDLGLDNIEFVGAKWGHELQPYLHRARFVVVPSIWYENFPYVIIQSFAAGKPVVGTEQGGIPELIQNGKHGLVYPADDSESLADRIRQLWNDEDGTRAMGKAARAYVEREFSDKNFYDTLMDIYTEVVS